MGLVAEVLYYAIPAFVLLLVVELLSFKYARDDDDLVGYEARDTRTSLTMGGGNVVINAVWKLVVLVVYAGLYELTPLRMPADEWWTYVLLFFADDLAYYWFHRVHHEVRVFWASHVVHHSSQHYNLSTALRQTWTPMTALPFWAPLALLGFAPWMILAAAGDQPDLPVLDPHRAGRRSCRRRFEFFFNTPSHHRVHHGANEVYLDRNYGGILIIWDRLFGTFQGETERVALRADEEHPHLPADPRRLPRVRRDRPRRARARRAGATGSATSSAARAGRRTAAAAAPAAEPRRFGSRAGG